MQKKGKNLKKNFRFVLTEESENNQVFLVSELSDVVFPFEVSLKAPYPNPFNPATTIEYEVPFGGAEINISIYDIRGRLVVELINEYMEASINPYKLTWNADHFSSGIYFVQMKSGLDIQTQKVMLII